MRRFLSSVVVAVALIGVGVTAWGQDAAKQGPDPAMQRDPLMEKDSFASLEKARFYFKTRKAYLASLSRCEEVLVGNPNFSKIDEVLFIAGVSSLRLAEKKGKQESKDSPEKLREKARDHLSELVNNYPESAFTVAALEELKALGGPKLKQP